MAGKIVHFEVPSGDADRASAFYNGLFGYEIGPSVMDGFEYRMFQSAEDQGGAIMSSETPGSGLVVYLDTDDIDASVARVRELGGSAEDKKPVPTHGWFSPCKDTEGNNFSLWQSDPNAA
jgi:predicted enzyme related to lactoylglutathione lyase